MGASPTGSEHALVAADLSAIERRLAREQAAAVLVTYDNRILDAPDCTLLMEDGCLMAPRRNPSPLPKSVCSLIAHGRAAFSTEDASGDRIYPF